MGVAGDNINAMRQGGVPEELIQEWADDRRAKLKAGRVPQSVIDEDFGVPAFDNTSIQAYAQENVADGKFENWLAGLQQSVSGLAVRQESPDLTIGPDANMAERLSFAAGTLIGDAPLMAGAFIGAGGPILGMGAAFAAPAAVRHLLMEKYENGEVESFSDFWERFSGAMVTAGKHYTVGVATGGAGQAAVALGAPTIVGAGAEVFTMTAVGAALDGRMPEPVEFLEAAILIGGLKGSVSVARKLRTIYARTGKTPSELLEDAKNDPTILEDVASDNVEVPRSYQPPSVVRLASEAETARATKAVKERLEAEAAPAEPAEAPAPEAAAPAIEVGKTRTTNGRREREINVGDEIGTQTRILIEQNKTQGGYDLFHTEISGATGESSATRLGHAADMRAAVKLAKVEGERIHRESQAEPAAEPAAKPVEAEAAVPRTEPTPEEIRAELEGEGFTGTEQGGPFDRAPPRPPDPPPAPPPPEPPSGRPILDMVAEEPKGPRKLWTWDDFVREASDDLDPLKRAVRAMAEGRDVEFVDDAYRQARNLRSVSSKGEHFITQGQIDIETLGVTGKSLEAIVEPVRGREADLRELVISRRVIELEGREIEHGFDVAAAEKVVSNAKAEPSGELMTAAVELTEYNHSTLRYMKEMFSDKEFESIIEANQSFTPFHRLMEDTVEQATSKRTKRVVNPVRRIHGGEQQIHDPLATTLKNTYLYTELAERNRVLLTFTRMAEETPGGEVYAKRAAKQIKRTKLDSKELKKIIDRVREDPKAELTPQEEAATKSAFEIFRMEQPPLRESQIVTFEKGERVVWDVDPELATIFNGLDRHSMGIITRVLAVPARGLRAGATLTPDFSVRNVFRDTFAAAINSESGFRLGIDSAIGAKIVFQGTLSGKGRHPVYQEWLRSGGPQAEVVALDRQYLQKNVREVFQRTGVLGSTRNAARHPVETLRILSTFSEQMTRVGEFNRALAKARKEAGVKGRDLTRAELEAAGFKSRDLLDFAKIGTTMRSVNNVSAFSNANVRGMLKVKESFQRAPLPTAAKIAAAITLPSILLRIVAQETAKDEREQGTAFKGFDAIPDWQKVAFWVVPVPRGDGSNLWLRIPKPFELGLVFGSTAEKIVDQMYKADPDAFADYLLSVAQQLVPSFLPTASVPVIEQYAERSIFRDRPLIPSRLEGIFPEQQFSPYTTALTRVLGSLIGEIPLLGETTFAAPLVIDNYVRGWTGGLGVYVRDIANAALTEAGVLPPVPRAADTLADLMFVKSFVIRNPSMNAQPIIEFYDRFNRIEKGIKTLKVFERRQDLPSFLELSEELGASVVNLTEFRDTMNDTASLVRSINSLPDEFMSRDEKRQYIDEQYWLMFNTAVIGNELFDEIDKLTEEGRKQLEREAAQ